MHSDSRKDRSGSVNVLDTIEQIIYQYLKPKGFRKYGRTLHRFVENDISQVVHFQNGSPGKGIYDILWVNLGIRVPECAERSFEIKGSQKKYYHEYECNIRTRLGSLVDRKDTYYDLREDPKGIAEDIVNRLQKYVIPVFDILNSRDAIVAHRREFIHFDQMTHHLLLLEEAMIFGRRGDRERASQRFNDYYNSVYTSYTHDLKMGRKIYLRKNERISYKNWLSNQMETITADHDGYLTIYDANPMHLRYLENLAEECGISLKYRGMST